MDYRSVLLVGAVLGASVVASSTACTSPDPGAITFSERETQGVESPSGSRGSKNNSTTTDAAPAGDSGGASNPIFGTTTFSYEDPGVVADTIPDHNGPVEGKDCITAGCHLDGAHPWVFAGTVYTAPQNGQTVPMAEVRVVGPDGTEVGHTYTDTNGNFWLDKPGTTIPAGSRVGVRKAGGSPGLMTTLLDTTNRGCNSTSSNCHGTTVTGHLYAP